MHYIRDMKTLAARLMWAREQKLLTQAGLAKLAGVSQGTIGNLESGLRHSARKIVNIAVALDVDPIWLSEGRGGVETRQEPSLTMVPERAAAEPKMTLAHEDELELLDLYRRADTRGRRHIQRAARDAASSRDTGDDAKPG